MSSLGSRDHRLTNCYTTPELELSKPNMTLLTGFHADMEAVYVRCSLNVLCEFDRRRLDIDRDNYPWAPAVSK